MVKMAYWVGTQGLLQLAKHTKTSSHCDVTPRKTLIQNEKHIFESEPEDLLNPFRVRTAL